jgi:hypothetical protein
VSRPNALQARLPLSVRPTPSWLTLLLLPCRHRLGRVRAGDAAFSRVEKVVRPSPLRPLRPSRLPPWSMYPRLARGHTRLPARPRRVTQNSELLAITYGALVAQLVEDYEDPAAINEQLEKMCEPPEPREPRAASREPRHRLSIATILGEPHGVPRVTLGRGYNIGMRIIEEFLAKTAELPLWSKTPCADFREAMDVVAKVRLRRWRYGAGFARGLSVRHARPVSDARRALCRLGSRCSSASTSTRGGLATRAGARPFPLAQPPNRACRCVG